MVHQRLSHLLAAKKLLRYVKGTLGYVLFSKYDINISNGIFGYFDSDWLDKHIFIAF